MPELDSAGVEKSIAMQAMYAKIAKEVIGPDDVIPAIEGAIAQFTNADQSADQGEKSKSGEISPALISSIMARYARNHAGTPAPKGDKIGVTRQNKSASKKKTKMTKDSRKLNRRK